MNFWRAATKSGSGKSIVVAMLVAVVPLASGCMSSTTPPSSTVQNSADETSDPTQDPAVTAVLPVVTDDIDGSDEAIAPGAPGGQSDPAQASAETLQGQTPQRETIASAIIIPMRSPRSGQSDAQLNEGVVMAFAGDEPARQAIEAVSTQAQKAQGEAIHGEPDHSQADADTEVTTDSLTPSAAPSGALAAKQPKNPGGLFGLLQARKMARARQESVRAQISADSAVSTHTTPVEQASPAAARTQGETGQNALPGVQSNKQLFALDEDEHAEDSAIELASVGSFSRLSPNGLLKQREEVEIACFKPKLVRLLHSIESHYGKPVIVTSGFRSPGNNRRAGGAKNSRHTTCEAADIQIEGISKWDLAKYLRTVPGRGGVGTYCRTRSVHIDVGTERDWHHPCRRKAKRKKA